MKRVLLIGDSIRMGYDQYVKLSLEGSAEVWYPEENCRFTQYVLRYLHEWVEKSGGEVDCLHWNAGLWDCLDLFEDGPATPIDIYRMYIDRICRRIRKVLPDAKVIFATSTPVDEASYLQPERAMRRNAVIEAYNAAAVEIVQSYGFAVNDLYGLLQNAPRSWYSDKTHFYTRAATEAITEQVVHAIQAQIDVRAKKPDYDALFAAPETISGF